MTGQARRMGESGRWRAGLAAGALLVLSLSPLATAPRAQADIEDLIFQPLIDAIAQSVSSVDPSLALSLDPGLDVSSIVAPSLAADAAPALAETGLAANEVPLTIHNTTEPLVNLSISGGQQIQALIDTGSNGLVVPWYDIGLQNLTFPTNYGIGAYSGGLDYFYVTLPDQTINFGNGIVTEPTTVDVELFAWPTTLQGLFQYPNFEAFLAPAGADGVLGIAPDAVGPDSGPTVISALPGDLSQGVLINEPDHYLRFGPDPLTGGVTVDGVANADLGVSINGGTHQPVSAIIDSGGVYGTLPSSVLGTGQGSGTVPVGTEISVYDQSSGQFLYSYTTAGSNSPMVVSGHTMNTGFEPFSRYPIYIGNDSVTTTFHNTAP